MEFAYFAHLTKEMRDKLLKALEVGCGIYIDKEADFTEEVKRVMQVETGIIENDLSMEKLELDSMVKNSKMDLEHLNILIIDDNEQITKMLTTFLELKNHKCVVASDGKQGLTLIQENKHDVVLLDLAMPEFDGYAVIKALELSLIHI